MSTDPFIYLAFIRQVVLALPGTTEALSHGTPAFYVSKKMIARIWEDGQVLVVRTDDRDEWIKKDPDLYFFTEHYRNFPSLLIRLEKVDPEELKTLLIAAWRNRASKTQVREYENNLH